MHGRRGVRGHHGRADAGGGRGRAVRAQTHRVAAAAVVAVVAAAVVGPEQVLAWGRKMKVVKITFLNERKGAPKCS